MFRALIALLVGGLLPALSDTTQAASSMKANVDRLVRSAEKLTGTWPTQAPPPIPEVESVARHGRRVAPRLAALLSEDPNVERDRPRWKVQQQAALRWPTLAIAARYLSSRLVDPRPAPARKRGLRACPVG